MKIKSSSLKQLFKASYYNAIIVVFKVLSGLVLSKVVAYFLGPSGLASLGNLRNFIKIATSFTAEGYQNATVRYVSEFSDNKEQKERVISTIFQLSLCISIFIGIILWVFSTSLSKYLFQTEDFTYVIKSLGIGLPFLSINLLLIYILNGLENYKKLVLVNISLSVGSMIVSMMLISKYSLSGALIAVTISPVVIFVINLLVLGKERAVLNNIFKTHLFSLKVLKNMNAYFIMAAYSAVIVAITLLLIRNSIVKKLNIDEAGYWEAMNRISSFYIMFFTSLTSFYLLPQFSKTNDFKVFKTKIKEFYILSIPLLLILFTSIYFLRFFLLKLLLSESFLPTSSLFFWQLVGDFIGILTIAMVKQFHARLMIKAYIVCNGILNISYFTLSYVFIDYYGLVGVTKAYALSYFIYFLLVITFVLNYFKKNIQT
jgi:PST family polysaccharide transporter